MRYVWIIILTISDLIWFIYTIKDLRKTIKYGFRFCDTEIYSQLFFIVHLIVLTVYSFLLYLYF